MEHLFVHLASQSRLPKLHKLCCWRRFIAHEMIAKIDALAPWRAAGQRRASSPR
jgi:hypothetical protein